MLLFHAPIPDEWLPRVLAHLPDVLVDHAHLERKAATSALNLQKYSELFPRLDELNEIAIEELEHFQLVLNLLRSRRIPFSRPQPSRWIRGLMGAIRRGRRLQVIDHLIVASLIEGRSCEKFQVLAEALTDQDPELSRFYGGLVESEGNHYASYILMAREIDDGETGSRLKDFLELEAELIRTPSEHAVLH
jgi:tRNA-(ms[2]io[6]A)-hydroxylase